MSIGDGFNLWVGRALAELFVVGALMVIGIVGLMVFAWATRRRP